MAEPRLIIRGTEEILIDRPVVTIGRASDNVIAFAEDSNVSRYHAEIENRGAGDYWLFDLNSSNGTKLNGEPVTAERPLSDGDIINIGGSQKIEVVLSDRPSEEPEEEPEEEPADVAEVTEEPEIEVPAEPRKSGVSVLLIIAGLALGLALISVIVVAAIYLSDGIGIGGACEASARIVKPQTGDILNQTTDIQIELNDPDGCVEMVVYTIDDEVVASSDLEPFSAKIDPNSFPGLSDGFDHGLKVVLVTADGDRIEEPTEVALNFDTLAMETPSPTPGETPGPGQDNGGGQTSQQPSVTLTDTKAMTERIIPQFSGDSAYVTGNPGFLDAVSKLTSEYAEPGYFQRARNFRDVINTEFVQERGLDPPLGYILAMSRSKFNPTNDQAGAGLWRMNNDLVMEFNYNGMCQNETIAQPTQNCAAIASSSYLKDMLLKAFGGNSGDIIYVVAAFGMKPLEAARWRQTLPEDRKDFWRVLQSDPQKQDQVARFFAAAIVAENPSRFGLKDDRPLSELYRNVMTTAAPAAK